MSNTIGTNTIKQNCVCCNDEINKTNLSCCNNHNMCYDCFNNQFNSQTNQTSVGDFIANNCKIVCGYCKAPYSDKMIIANITDEQYQNLCKIREDVIISKAESECEKKLEQKQKKSKIEQHRAYICENILTLHCKRCNSAIFDFDGCFAIECNACKGSMCGWCLGDFSPDAHQHVMTCKHSLNPGSHHGTFEQFNQIHTQKRAKEIKKYLASIYLDEEKEQVKLAIKKDLEDIGVNLDVDGNYNVKINSNNNNEFNYDTDDTEDSINTVILFRELRREEERQRQVEEFDEFGQFNEFYPNLYQDFLRELQRREERQKLEERQREERQRAEERQMAEDEYRRVEERQNLAHNQLRGILLNQLIEQNQQEKQKLQYKHKKLRQQFEQRIQQEQAYKHQKLRQQFEQRLHQEQHDQEYEYQRLQLRLEHEIHQEQLLQQLQNNNIINYKNFDNKLYYNYKNLDNKIYYNYKKLDDKIYYNYNNY